MQADIGLILEGTYPYVRGGVSSWIHQIIGGLPEFTFTLIFIGSKKADYGEIQYDMPANVVNLSCFYLVSESVSDLPKTRKGHKKAFVDIRRMYEYFQTPEKSSKGQAFGDVLRHIKHLKTLDLNDFLYSEEAWDFITERYEKGTPTKSFLDYFWSIRAMHQPIFALIDALDGAPDATVYHTISTGYAGLFGVMLHHLKQRQLILTEHGIYTKERKIDLSQVEWIEDSEKVGAATLNGEISYLRSMWIKFFEALGRITYDVATPVIAISEGNKNRQIKDGADPDKTFVVSNAINLENLQPQRVKRPETRPLVVGFIGRVVPIKDVKTFIRAMRNVCSEIPAVEAWIIGGEEEDPKYAQECRDMIASLDLVDDMIYKGFCNVAEMLPKLGCVVLSSISEGLPLVVLEAFACGIPIISTDVGACRELIEGGSEEDKALGFAGATVSIANSEELANEIVRLFNDPEYGKRLSKAAEQRADKYFGEQSLFDSYREVYSEALER
ncbi:MAG: GT4 family glycosyltransferase PelF [Methylococcales bacterium]|nr:GT4 family glycosyltransferase PelF [Methylococcales bacterium]